MVYTYYHNSANMHAQSLITIIKMMTNTYKDDSVLLQDDAECYEDYGYEDYGCKDNEDYSEVDGDRGRGERTSAEITDATSNN